MDKRQKQAIILAALKQYKIKKRLTTEMLSDALGIPSATLTAWLSGQRRPGETAMGIIEDFLEKAGLND